MVQDQQVGRGMAEHIFQALLNSVHSQAAVQVLAKLHHVDVGARRPHVHHSRPQKDSGIDGK